MVESGEHEEQKHQRWRDRFVKGRLSLSASLDESLVDRSLQEEEALEEENPQPEPAASVLIRPRLSLQSKQLPAVRVEQAQTSSTGKSDAGRQTSDVPAQQKKRLAGRATRVRLQAVPRHEMSPSSELLRGETLMVETGPTPVTAQERTTETSSAVQVHSSRREKLSGSGVFLQGQTEAMIENRHVTAASVIAVTLLGNPGPVVVQYYSLLPGFGFKAHLSAPAAGETPFNYVILLGELF